MVMAPKVLDTQSGDKVLSLMQPTYFPWLGYFNLIKQSDVFVVYTTTQLQKRSWQVRNKIKTSQGETYLSIPILKTASRDNLTISTAEISYDSNWVNKHLSSIQHAYKKTPYFDEIYPIIESHLISKPKYLFDITYGMLLEFVSLLDINTTIVLSDDIDYTGSKDEALISICQALDVKNYLSVKGSMDYILDGVNLFEKNNINLLWHEYSHPTYPQVNGDFIPYLGIIDALFNIGPEETKKLI